MIEIALVEAHPTDCDGMMRANLLPGLSGSFE
jgi:hypothetical protein